MPTTICTRTGFCALDDSLLIKDIYQRCSHFCLYMIGLWLTGCASIPDAKLALSEISSQTQPITVITAKQTLPPGKVAQALKKLSPDESMRASLAEHLRVEQALSGNHLYADNKVTLLFNGELTFSHMRQALAHAQQHIHLEYFTLEDVDLGGITLQALLLEKLSQGVSVHLIYDDIGSADTPPALFDRLKAAGAKITVFHPVHASTLTRINQRDHRKILVVDGKQAIVGGVNLSKTYQSKGSLRFFSKQKLPDLNQADWRDTDIMITGPVVADIQQAFLEHWDTTQPLDTTSFFPPLAKQGGQFVRVITTPASKRKNTDSPYYLALIAAIQHAQHRIILNSAYFVPTSAQEEALVEAADRGVQVSLLVPSFSDSTLSMNVQRSHYSHLLKHGVAIYEMQDQVLHAKMVSIDGVWSVIGSSNLDYRSAGINAEIDVVILGNETANLLESRFQQDLENAEKIEWQQWQQRPLWQKLKQQSSRIFEGIL